MNWLMIFNALNQKYSLARHNISIDTFMRQPEKNEKLIHIYFANPNLFFCRKNNTKILLQAFLRHSDDILLAVLADEDNHEPRPLLAKQKVAVISLEFWASFSAQPDYRNHAGLNKSCLSQDDIELLSDWFDKRMSVETMTGIHNNAYTQSMRHFEPTSKRKTRGGHYHD